MVRLHRKLMPGVFLNRQCHIAACLLRHGIQLLCHWKAVLVLCTAENPKRYVLLENGTNHIFRLILQYRNPGALQDQQIAVCGRTCDRPQKHIASGREAAAGNVLIALGLYPFQGICHRQIGSAVIAPAVGPIAVRLGTLDRFQLPQATCSNNGFPICPPSLGHGTGALQILKYKK